MLKAILLVLVFFYNFSELNINFTFAFLDCVFDFIDFIFRGLFSRREFHYQGFTWFQCQFFVVFVDLFALFAEIG